MKNYKAKDVDSYIAGAELKSRAKLAEIRKLIKSTVTDAEESISYGVPFYKYHGLLAGFAAHKNHVGIWFPASPLGQEDISLLNQKGFETGAKTIKIGFDQPVPAPIIKRILKAAAKRNEARRKKK